MKQIATRVALIIVLAGIFILFLRGTYLSFYIWDPTGQGYTTSILDRSIIWSVLGDASSHPDAQWVDERIAELARAGDVPLCRNVNDIHDDLNCRPVRVTSKSRMECDGIRRILNIDQNMKCDHIEIESELLYDPRVYEQIAMFAESPCNIIENPIIYPEFTENYLADKTSKTAAKMRLRQMSEIYDCENGELGKVTLIVSSQENERTRLISIFLEDAVYLVE